MELRFGDQAARTRAVAFVPNGGDDDPSNRSVLRPLGHQNDSLFWIVGRVSKHFGVYSPCDPVEAFDDDAILVGLYEFVIEHGPPDSMKKISLAMSQKITIVLLVSDRGQQLLDGLWQLLKAMRPSDQREKINRLH
jgi:hypothetical protein